MQNPTNNLQSQLFKLNHTVLDLYFACRFSVGFLNFLNLLLSWNHRILSAIVPTTGITCCIPEK